MFYRESWYTVTLFPSDDIKREQTGGRREQRRRKLRENPPPFACSHGTSEVDKLEGESKVYVMMAAMTAAGAVVK